MGGGRTLASGYGRVEHAGRRLLPRPATSIPLPHSATVTTSFLDANASDDGRSLVADEAKVVVAAMARASGWPSLLERSCSSGWQDMEIGPEDRSWAVGQL